MSISTNTNYTIIDNYFQAISYQIKFDFISPPSNPFVRTIDYIVEHIDTSDLLNLYKSNSIIGGRPFYNVKQMLKILILARSQNLSYRKIIKAIKTDDEFKWFARDFNGSLSLATLSLFHSNLDKCQNNIFLSMYFLLTKLNLIDPSVLFTDGTTIKAYNSRFKRVRKDKVEKQLKLELAKITPTTSPEDLATINQNIELLNKKFDLLKGRNSCGINDNDAYLVKDKRNHYMVGYNAQVVSENKHGLIVGYYLGDNPADNAEYIKTLERTFSHTGIPKICVADAGYGNEENYQYLKEKGITAVVKPLDYNNKKDDSDEDKNITLNDFQILLDKNIALCPNNRVLNKTNSNYTRTANTGYKIEVSTFKSNDCSNCEFSKRCLNKDKSVRDIKVSLNRIKLVNEANTLLSSVEGNELYTRRFNICEAKFGHIKYNTKFREFTRVGFTKASTQLLLSILSYNLLRISNILEV